MNNLTPKQALDNLYTAARLAPMTFREHEACVASYNIIISLIKPEKKPIEKKETVPVKK